MTCLIGDCRSVLPTLEAGSVQMCVTSPPYWGLRDYGVAGQLGLEPTPEQYVANMVQVFAEVRRVLRDDGVLWLNLGDSYAGSGKGGNPEGSEWSGFVGNKAREKSAQASKPIIPTGLKPKDLVGIPWRTAFALQADGWYLRQDIIWAKPNPMPESVRDRCTKSHEYLFLLSKRERYYFDADAISEPAESFGRPQPRPEDKTISPNNTPWLDNRYAPGPSGFGHSDNGTRNKRSVWTIATQPYSEAHFATFPPALIEPCILAGSKPGDVVLDPFFGSGTTGQVCERLGRQWLGIELNGAYGSLARDRTAQMGMVLA